MTPHDAPLCFWQSSIAFAPSNGSASSTARPSSQTNSAGLAILPSQLLSVCIAAGSGLPAASSWSTSTAPGFTFGSQSLQSPCATVKPSLSWSGFVAEGWQPMPEPALPPAPVAGAPPPPNGLSDPPVPVLIPAPLPPVDGPAPPAPGLPPALAPGLPPPPTTTAPPWPLPPDAPVPVPPLPVVVPFPAAPPFPPLAVEPPAVDERSPPGLAPVPPQAKSATEKRPSNAGERGKARCMRDLVSTVAA